MSGVGRETEARMDLKCEEKANKSHHKNCYITTLRIYLTFHLNAFLNTTHNTCACNMVFPLSVSDVSYRRTPFQITIVHGPKLCTGLPHIWAISNICDYPVERTVRQFLIYGERISLNINSR